VRGWKAYGDDDGGLGGHLVGHVDVHLDLGWVVSKVADLLQRGAEACRRRGSKPKERLEEHGGWLTDVPTGNEKAMANTVP
jgi:hypothetical protein